MIRDPDRKPVAAMLATLRLVARLALRDLRGGIGGMRIVLACLALGVAAIGAVGGLQGMIHDGIAGQQRSLLGGDLSIESSDPFPAELATFVTAHGARVSEILRMRSMLYAPGGRMLVELQAVDAAYPLVGTVTITPPGPLDRALAAPGTVPAALLADPLVIARLGLAPGAAVRVGSAQFRMAGTLAHTPDSATTVVLAPAVMIARPALDAAGLLQPGALVNRALRIALDGPDQGRAARAQALAGAIAARFPDQGWRIRGTADAAPALTRTIDQIARFLRLIGLTALLLGGLGVSAGVTSWLEGRGGTIAILRCLGAPSTLVSLTFGLQIAVLCILGIGGGMVLALLLPPLAVHALSGLLPLTATLAPPVRPALLAGLFGVLVALLSVILPLTRASAIPPAALFHDQGRQRPLGRSGRLRAGLAMAACAILLGGLAGLLGGDRLFVAGFLAIALAVGGVLALAGGALRRVMAALLPRMGTDRGVLRLGLALFARPGAPTARLMVALGAGLTGMATITLVEGAIMAQLRDQMPRNAPAFYFVDIQPADLDRFDTLARSQPSVRAIQQVPSMRTRIVAVNGVPAERVAATPQTQWALRGDHGLTLSAMPPPGTQLAEGTWWPADYDGPPLLSLDAGLAQGWGVRIGSVIRLNVLGRSIDVRVANLRRVAWRSLQLNFAFVVSPGLLSHAPHTFVATLATDGRADRDAAVLAAITDALPGVTGIRVADVLAELGTLVGRLAAALTAASSIILMSGGLVLAATLAAGWRQRVTTAATLRALGADSGQIRTIWLVEFTLLGFTAGLAATILGTLIAWLVTRTVLQMPWTADWTALIGTMAGTLLVTTLCGMVVWRRTLRQAVRSTRGRST
ncbi:ABC transporter permease [Gluconacetobacter diazotrophicus]|uniref:Putative permease protein n=1 Tax=Gluconacetobacter diazotrophicus (strain ATCC 49037 / DSM 5601 / CCUG 37298 / CIP 103539 / LMG 7603 / PAl5) TaxID=272568 RepID=A9HDY3_GLUDA|nr:FtsX-like permease family protein [Gluconacetobacter diazotrophicus]CAP55160.1 putative permease protein [Gluconacetobacter diazotrophicus PA1 5]